MMGWGESRGQGCIDGGVHPFSLLSGQCPCGRFRLAGYDIADTVVEGRIVATGVRLGDTVSIHEHNDVLDA